MRATVRAFQRAFSFRTRKGQDRREKGRKKNETATKREGGARGKKEVARGDTKVSKDVTRERESERAMMRENEMRCERRRTNAN